MVMQALELMTAGMGSVFAFLAFLIGMMYAAAAVFAYIGPEEESAQQENNAAETEAVVAALAAVALKK